MNILTIDLEDWFHILAHDKTASPHQWEKFESRVERNTDWILEILAKNNQQATFFCLGWIAKRYPALIKKIEKQKHEIACHSMNHQLVYEQTPQLYKEDLSECINLLEEISGQKIKTYRAPGFSVSEKTKWVFDVLVENGIENDCSVFPIARNHGGYKNFTSKEPCIISVSGIQLREFPMSVSNFWGKSFVFSGGGYFRLLPYPIIKSSMKRSEYVMTYFHPRDFDSEQPMLSSLTLKRKFMSYTGLKGAKNKFEKLLSDFPFLNVEQAAKEINWSSAPKIDIKY